jgi:hypothetical protein
VAEHWFRDPRNNPRRLWHYVPIGERDAVSGLRAACRERWTSGHLYPRSHVADERVIGDRPTEGKFCERCLAAADREVM